RRITAEIGANLSFRIEHGASGQAETTQIDTDFEKVYVVNKCILSSSSSKNRVTLCCFRLARGSVFYSYSAFYSCKKP
ncbi:MAG TPA: hypothetical protein VGB77_18895, partial [Abditibacteriaceae bacterium]